MLSYITEPFRRFFRGTREQTSDRSKKRRMIPVDTETDGPVAKRFHHSSSAILPRSIYQSRPNNSQQQLDSHGFGNCVQDWFMKISQMAAKPVVSFSLGQMEKPQLVDFSDEETENDPRSSVMVPNERKKGKKHQPTLETLTREPLHSANPWKAISSNSEYSWNGTWDETYERSGVVGEALAVSVRRKQKSNEMYPQNNEEEVSSNESSNEKSSAFHKKFRKLKKPNTKRYKTPFEPIRLEEKEKYRLLLEKCKVGDPPEIRSKPSRKYTVASSASSNGSTPAYNGHIIMEKLSDSSKSHLSNRLHPINNGIRNTEDGDFKMYGGPRYLTQDISRPSKSVLNQPTSTKRFLSLKYLEKFSTLGNESPGIFKNESFHGLRRPSSEDSGRSTEHSSSKETVLKRNSVPVSENSPFSQKWMKDLEVALDDSIKSRTEKQDVLEKRTRQFREKREAKIFAENRKSLHRLKKSLNLKSPDASEEEDDAISQLPELTPEIERKIEEALRPNPGEEVLCEGFRLSIARRDMETLSGLNWLNDEIINFYMNLLMERGKNDNFPACYAFNTFFYPKLISGGHSVLKRWTRKVDIFSHDFILIPVHLGMHWCLAVIDFPQKRIQYYDSMGGQNNECVNALRNYLQDESMDKKKKEYDMTDWKLETVKNIPQQMNGSDCGMFTLKYAEYITRNAKITFSQRHMPYFRRRMVYEIVTKTLL